MKFDISTPVYLQVIDQLKKRMITGKIKPGEKLPSGRELSHEFTINPNTSARVYKEMEISGLCFTKRGVGTFATEDEMFVKKLKGEMAEKLIGDCLKGLLELGFTREEVIAKMKEMGETQDVGI